MLLWERARARQKPRPGRNTRRPQAASHKSATRFRCLWERARARRKPRPGRNTRRPQVASKKKPKQHRIAQVLRKFLRAAPRFADTPLHASNAPCIHGKDSGIPGTSSRASFPERAGLPRDSGNPSAPTLLRMRHGGTCDVPLVSCAGYMGRRTCDVLDRDAGSLAWACSDRVKHGPIALHRAIQSTDRQKPALRSPHSRRNLAKRIPRSCRAPR